jgi:hypothetical protein
LPGQFVPRPSAPRRDELIVDQRLERLRGTLSARFRGFFCVSFLKVCDDQDFVGVLGERAT